MFPSLFEGYLINRPNRFIMNVEVDGQQKRMYCANPGRLKELVFSGVKVLYRHSDSEKTQGTVMAIERNGSWVWLHTGEVNGLVEKLIQTGAYPGLEGWSVVRREVTCGESRFDFLLSKGSKQAWAEVKCCTLFAGNGAYFPDAPSPRAVKHLLGLQQLADQGEMVFALPVVMSHRPLWWCPDWNTDLNFAQTVAQVRHQVPFLAVGLGFDSVLNIQSVRSLPIPFDFLQRRLTTEGFVLCWCQVQGDFYWSLQYDVDVDRAIRRRKNSFKNKFPCEQMMFFPLRGHGHLDVLLDQISLVSRQIKCDLNGAEGVFISSPTKDPQIMDKVMDMAFTCWEPEIRQAMINKRPF